MRLLYVCSDYGIALDGVKGASVHLRAITRALAERGHQVSVLAPRGNLPTDHPARMIDVEPNPLVDDVHHELRDWLADRELDESVARELRPLIYSATIVERVINAMASQPPEAIVERLSLFGHVGLDLASVFHVPYIVEVNAPLTKEASQFRSLNLRALGGEIERRVLEKADGVAVVSGALAERLALKGVDAGKIRVVPNGVDGREFDGLSARGMCRPASIPKDAFVVGFAGSLKPWHGVSVLVAAFAEIAERDAEARLVIVGTGPAEGQILAAVAKLGLGNRVLLSGAVPHEEVPRWLRAMDVAVAPFLPVEDFYFSPIKLFEYMASGACVIASRMGQIAEVIEDGVDGLLCRPDDVADLIRQLERARGDRALRESLGRRAEAKVRERYTWGHAAEAVDEMIAGIVDCRLPNEQWVNRLPERTLPNPPGVRGKCGIGFPREMGARWESRSSNRAIDMAEKESNQPARVGYLLRMYPRFSQTFVVNEIRELERQGVDIRIASLRLPDEGMFHESVTQVKARADYLEQRFLGCVREQLAAQWKLWRRDGGAYRQAVRLVRAHEGVLWFELCQAAALVRWAKKQRIDHVHVHFGTDEANVALLASKLGGPSYSLTLHAFDIFRDNVDRALLAKKINGSRFTVTVCESNRRFIVENILNVDPSKVRVNYNGIDTEGFSPSGTDREPMSIFSVGRLIEKKGFAYLIRAVGLLRDRGVRVICRIAGEGREQKKLQEEIRALGLKGQVELVGAMRQDEVRSAMQHAACFALPCVQAKDGNIDALPTVLLEAMACGCPTVSTRLSGIPEIIEDGVSGTLVAPDSAAELASALERVLTDGAWAARLSAEGRRRAVQRFDVTQNVAVMRTWLEAAAGKERTLPVVALEPSAEEMVPATVSEAA